jgi:hypothetical protein
MISRVRDCSTVAPSYASQKICPPSRYSTFLFPKYMFGYGWRCALPAATVKPTRKTQPNNAKPERTFTSSATAAANLERRHDPR